MFAFVVYPWINGIGSEMNCKIGAYYFCVSSITLVFGTRMWYDILSKQQKVVAYSLVFLFIVLYAHRLIMVLQFSLP